MRENAVCKGQKTLEVTELTADIITELTKAVPEKYEFIGGAPKRWRTG